jgi:hypothetical protein
MREGDLFSVKWGDGVHYTVAKLLKLEDGIVHVRLYANQFPERPTEVDTDSLRLGTIHDEAFGIGHLPLASQEFGSWEPELIQHGRVEAEELEGYEEWREMTGGSPASVFGARVGLIERLRYRFRRT